MNRTLLNVNWGINRFGIHIWVEDLRFPISSKVTRTSVHL